jgi:heme/copper-type cytochrome/quinol oxidase subunit 4
MSFKLAHSLSHSHLIVQPSDLSLNPPESYLFIQDFLIIACGTLYLLCYLFYITRTIRDRRLAGPVEYMSSTMSYEIFYAIATTSTTFERACFMAWFAFDLAFVSVAIRFAYPAAERKRVAARTAGGTVVGLVVFWALARTWPDEREQLTGFWTGILLQLPINWGSLWVLVRDQSTKGHSLEIW